eukprot:543512_1
MKVHVSINRRCPWCFFVRRRGHLYVACKMHGRHKQRQGTKLGIKYVNNRRKYKGWYSTSAYNDVNYDNLETIDGELMMLCDNENDMHCQCAQCQHRIQGLSSHQSNVNLSWNEQFKLFSDSLNTTRLSQ